MIDRISQSGRAVSRRLGPLGTTLTLAGAAIVVASCASVERVVMQPPVIPGAEYLGMDDCSLCHEEIVEGFAVNAHARLLAPGENALGAGCEACHGPGSLHFDEGGTANSIYNPGRSSEACLNCHLESRSQFMLPNSHPVLDGPLACIDCHDPHSASGFREVAGEGMLDPVDDLCLDCHVEQRGPFVFDHEAMRDGCTQCHTVHGSVNEQLLKTRNANLCLQCHYTRHQGDALFIGGVDHAGFGFMGVGTCWTAGCHEAVHGSNVNSSLRY